MGARPYIPLLGRFLSVDPQEGGSANDYVAGGPINTVDLDGHM
ncbi:RHS repeat-associated core domain-containing protein [Amycolatopsis deserti]|nr:RHS repeat-associated core domain-containing protein [Amycolatopsis deserti]